MRKSEGDGAAVLIALTVERGGRIEDGERTEADFEAATRARTSECQ